MKTMTDFIFLGSKITADWDCSHEIKRHLLFGRKAMTNWKARQCIQKQRHHFAYKDLYSQSYGFSCSHIWMWELDYKELWTLKNRYFWIVVLEKTLESPLDCKEIQPSHPKWNQSWIFTERTETETPVLWPPDVKTDSLEKTLMLGHLKAGEKGMTEDEMVRWHHHLKGHKFE